MTPPDRRLAPGDERRKRRRVPAHLLPTLSTQLSGGAPVTLLDVSHRGVRLETTRHMRPGQTVAIRFSVDGRDVTINAVVVRASVAHLESDDVRYETGLALSDDFSCNELEVALVERRRQTRHDLEATADHVTGSFGPEHRKDRIEVGARLGWWLTQKRPRTRKLVLGS